MKVNLQSLRRIIREEVMKFGPVSAEIGEITQDVDLSDAATALKNSSEEELMDLVALNTQIYNSIDRKDAWESIGEQLLTSWGFEVPIQGRKSPEGAGDVTTFWDVKKSGVLFSVKTSFKSPTSPGNYRQATQSSNIKISSLISAIRENPGSYLGNIGCVYSEENSSRTIWWGEVFEQFSAEDLSARIRFIIEQNVPEDEGLEDVLLAYDSLVSLKTNKKMSQKEYANMTKIENSLYKMGMLSSKGRLTHQVEDFLGQYIDRPVASLTVYEPNFFYDFVFNGGEETKTTERATEEDRNTTIRRLSTMMMGMSKNQIDSLIDAAKKIRSSQG